MIEDYPKNLYLNDFMKLAHSAGARVQVQCLSDVSNERSSVRGCWIFGIEIISDNKISQYKLVTATNAKIQKTIGLNCVASRLMSLGYSPIIVPTKAMEMITYSQDKKEIIGRNIDAPPEAATSGEAMNISKPTKEKKYSL